MCPPDSYISAMKMKFENSVKGGDDTATNGFYIRCRKLDGQMPLEFEVGNTGPWGEWKGWSKDF